MSGRVWTRVVIVLIGLAVAGGLVALGRASAGRGTGGAGGPSYTDGLAEGVREGRALQVTASLPAGSGAAARAAFEAGYAAGANDVFGGYDGGWGLSERYVITLVPGSDGITYRIASRTPVSALACPTPR